MLIHAYLRKETTEVTLHGLTLAFTPNEHKHCVAEVTHAAAIERLLSIKEGYRQYDIDLTLNSLSVPSLASIGSQLGNLSAGVIAIVPPVPLGSDAFPEEVELAEDRFVTVGDVARAAFERSGLDLDAWNTLAEMARTQLMGIEIDMLRTGLKTTEEDDETIEQREREESARELQEAKDKAEAEAVALALANPTPAAPSTDPLVLTDGATTIDIGKMTAAEVRAVAAAENVELPKGNSTKLADLRILLAKALKGD